MQNENLYPPEILIDFVLQCELPIGKIAKDTNIPLPTIKNYVYGKTEASSMSYRMMKSLTDFFRNGQPLEIMLMENDCVMVTGDILPGRDLPHIDNPQTHTFKTLSELFYRAKTQRRNNSSQFDPFLVVLTEEILYFFQVGYESRFIADLIINAKTFNLKFVTSEDILMNSQLSSLRYRLFERYNVQPFAKCCDVDGLKKLEMLDKTFEQPNRVFSSLDCGLSIMSKYAYYLALGYNSDTIAFSIADNLEPGCLNSFENDAIMSNPKPKRETVSLIFDTLTSKFDFITAISVSKYDDLFQNTHPYYTESQFSGEPIDPLDDGPIKSKTANHLILGSIDNNIADITHPIRLNYFDLHKFIVDRNVDTTKDIKINVANKFMDESGSVTYISRYLIHSIEYTDSNDKSCTYIS